MARAGENGERAERSARERVLELLERLDGLYDHPSGKRPKPALVLAVSRELTRAVELLAKIDGHIQTGTNVTLQLNQLFAEIGVADKTEAMRLIGVARGLEGLDAEAAKEAILAAAMEIGRAEPVRLIPLLKLVPWAVELEPGE